MHRDENGQGAVIGWIALIVAIAALALAWTAFNRTGENLEDMVRDEVQQQSQPTQTQQSPETNTDGLPGNDTGPGTETDPGTPENEEQPNTP
jgi:hypothetical protein